MKHTRTSQREWLGSRSGQTLGEVLIGLSIGALLMGAASLSVVTMIKVNASSHQWRAGNQIAQAQVDTVRVYGSANWSNIYGLTKSSSTQYYLMASGTVLTVQQGVEGVVDNDVRKGLIGEWQFDEASGTSVNDASGNGLSATIAGTLSRATSTCYAGYCAYATGTTAQAAITYSNVFDTTNFTYSLWVNPLLIKSGGAYTNIILGRENYGVSGFRFGIDTNQTPIFWTTQSGGNLSLQSATSIALNQYSHIVVTYNGTTAKMYVNGALTATATGTYYAPGNVQLVINGGIGGTQSSNSYIDDVRAYNRELSGDEVSRLYTSNVFARYFYIDNVCRTTDSSGSITGVSPCATGSGDDPSTQKISSVTTWPLGNRIELVKISDYVTRSRNNTYTQNSWLSGPGASSPVTGMTSTFTTSSNAFYGSSSIYINDIVNP